MPWHLFFTGEIVDMSRLNMRPPEPNRPVYPSHAALLFFRGSLAKPVQSLSAGKCPESGWNEALTRVVCSIWARSIRAVGLAYFL